MYVTTIMSSQHQRHHIELKNAEGNAEQEVDGADDGFLPEEEVTPNFSIFTINLILRFSL